MLQMELVAPVDQVAIDVEIEYSLGHNTVSANFGSGIEPLFSILVYYPIQKHDFLNKTREEIYATRDRIESEGIKMPV